MPQPAGGDPAKVDSKHYKVEFENDRVRVLRAKYAAGEKSVMHSHPALVATFLTEGHARFTFPDGRTETAEVAAGTVQYFDAQVHLPENIGTKPLEVILVEFKK
jgi:quercetin dioxygenase-like cupin family protein